MNRSQRVWDIVERVAWTAVQGGAAEGIVLATGWSQAWTVPIMALLATIKTTLASKFGTTSAATLPASLDAAAPGDTPPPSGQDLFKEPVVTQIPAEVLAKSRHPSGKGLQPGDPDPKPGVHRDYPA